MPTAEAAISLMSLLPETLLMVAGCAVLLAGQGAAHKARQAVTWITLTALVAALLLVRFDIGGQSASELTIAGGLLFDSLARFMRITALLLAVLITLVSWATPQDDERGEFFAMMLFSVCGLMLVGAAANLLILFLGLELVSIPAYVMIALSRRSPLAPESAIKYFFLGALAAALTAFGFSYLYGVIGGATLDAAAVGRLYAALVDTQAGAVHYVAVAGLLLSFLGLLFKIAAVPLHFYVADVYQGAASPVAGLLGFVPKAAGVVAIIKVLGLSARLDGAGWLDGWGPLEYGPLFGTMWLVAALTMTVGNVLALQQRNIKRMLAYSGIAHSGYMLVGILVGPGQGGLLGDGTAAVLYYVVIYGIANLTAFGLLGMLRVDGRPAETLRDVAGMLRYHPSLALLMALAMFTLMGLPPTPGFWGKLSLFGSALSAGNRLDGYQSWLVALVVVALVNSAIGAAYYLRVIAAVLLYESDQPAQASERQAPLMGGLLCGFLLLAFMFYPTRLLLMGRAASGALRQAPVPAVRVEPPATPPVALIESQQ